MDVRKAHSEKPWPPHDRDVGVILVAHSMGGFVAMDALSQVLNDRIANHSEDVPLFPPIQGILTFDTPYNGLARSMFVYGAFSNYQKVSSVFNVMTALSAAAPSALGRMSLSRAAATSAPAPRSSNPAAWKSWQLIAVRTGTVGAIAAGGVAAYMHRNSIMEGMKSMRNLNSQSVKDGYQQSKAALGEGLAYINRGNVGQSFQYLAEHFTYVGALMKQQELSRRLERMGALKGVGIHDYYTSLGENGIWSGGYFIPERTFCAIPATEHAAYRLFSRQVVAGVDDEVQAHVSMFKRDKNEGYDAMTTDASNLVVRWFEDDSPIDDDPKFAAPVPPEPVPEPIEAAGEGKELPESGAEEASDLPDESPLDIAAAASLVPLPDDDEQAPDTLDAAQAEKSTYMRYLLGVAQQAGTGLGSYVPRKMPDLPQMPSGTSLKSYIPSQMPQMPQLPQMPNLPSVNVFGKKQQQPGGSDEGAEQTGEKKVAEEAPHTGATGGENQELAKEVQT
jgi:hypothetical protein